MTHDEALAKAREMAKELGQPEEAASVDSILGRPVVTIGAIQVIFFEGTYFVRLPIHSPTYLNVGISCCLKDAIEEAREALEAAALANIKLD
jgi:hypothetical protein